MKAVWTFILAILFLPGTLGSEESISVLVFTKTGGYRHASIVAGTHAVERIGDARGWDVASTDDSARFTDGALERFDVIVFLNTSGRVMNQLQQAAFERFIESGRGFVGVHGAADTGPGWPWYQRLVGAVQTSHGDVTRMVGVVEDRLHPSTSTLPVRWWRNDAPVGFDRNPRPTVNVVMTLDESSYQPGRGRMGDHPIAWYHEYDNGRAYYTGLGHTQESYEDEMFLRHLSGAILWASGGAP